MSDLHVGLSARSSDMCPDTHEGAVDDDYRIRFRDFVRSNELEADLLIATGDITDRARPDEMALATEVLAEFAEELTGDPTRIVSIPGNHDVDWMPLQGDSDDRTGFRKDQRFAPARNSGWVLRNSQDRGTGDLFAGDFFCSWTIDGALIVGMNSASHDGPDVEWFHHGLAPQDSVEQLDRFLSSLEIDESELRIFLVHHHPIQYSSLIPDLPDPSILVNSENLLEVVARHRFDVVAHGHRHEPKFRTQQVDDGHHLAVLGCGSFSAMLGNEYAGCLANQFHLMSVDGREEGRVYGLLRNWAFAKNTGWRPSSQTDGIEHEIGFGADSDTESLRREIGAFVGAEIARQNFVTFGAIQDAVASIRYVQRFRRVEILSLVAEDHGLTVHEAGAETILLRDE